MLFQVNRKKVNDPGGMLMPGRVFSSASGYRYGFNGKEKVDEIKGSGNSLDYGARIYAPRLVRWLSVDPLYKKYPSESPFLYTGGNPILYIDEDGRDRILYIQAILKDGTVIKLGTKRIVNNEVRLHVDKAYVGWDIYATDVQQVVTYDMRTGKWTLSRTESAYSSRRSTISEGLMMEFGLGGDDRPRGKQKGGLVLTSSFATGSGPDTDATHETNRNPINIDLVIAMMGAALKQPAPPEMNGLAPAEFTNLMKDIDEAINAIIPDKNENKKKPAAVIQRETRPSRWSWSDNNGGSSEMPRMDTLKKKGSTPGAPDTFKITEIKSSPNPSKNKKN